MTNFLNEIKYQKSKYKDKWRFMYTWLKRVKKKRQSLTKTILVIRLDAIGDCIIWLDQAKEYRKAFPNYKIVLLHNKAWTEIAERLPWFDEFIAFDRKKIGDIEYNKKILTSLNRYTYEKTFSPVFSRDIYTVDWFIHNINSLEKIGYEGDYINNLGMQSNNIYYRTPQNQSKLKHLADSWYTTIVDNNECCVMELQRNAHFVRKTLNNNFRSQLPTIPFSIPKPIIQHQSPYAIFFLGASSILKTWPVEKFVYLTERIDHPTIILCGSAIDKPLAETFNYLYKGNKKIIDMTGCTSLIDLIALIAHASIVVTNDTSASHIAVATRTLSVCLLGGGLYGRFHPYHVEEIDENEKLYLPAVVTSHDKSCFHCNCGCKYPLLNKRWRCVNDINVEDVCIAIHQLL